MAGSLAPALNEAGQANDIDLLRKQVGIPDPAINPQLKDALTGGTWWDRTKAYLGDTNWGNVGQALMRLAPNPLTQAQFLISDLSQGTAIDNARTNLGQVARMPTDIAAGVVGLPAVASTVKQGLFGGDALPMAEGSAQAAGAIDEFGRKIGETIAGRPLTNELLRGTPEQMSGNWLRTLGEAIIPTPAKFTAPVLTAATNLTRAADAVFTGTNLIEKSTALAGKTLEALTPLAISSAPSMKTALLNVGAQGVLAPLAEAAFSAAKPAEQALQGQAQADQIAKEGTAINTQGVTQAATVSNAVQAVKPVLAGGLPTQAMLLTI